MTQNMYQTTIVVSILITTVMITFIPYVFKGYYTVTRYLYHKTLEKYPELSIDNWMLRKLIDFTIKLHLTIGYLILIYIVIISLLQHKP